MEAASLLAGELPQQPREPQEAAAVGAQRRGRHQQRSGAATLMYRSTGQPPRRAPAARVQSADGARAVDGSHGYAEIGLARKSAPRALCGAVAGPPAAAAAAAATAASVVRAAEVRGQAATAAPPAAALAAAVPAAAVSTPVCEPAGAGAEHQTGETGGRMGIAALEQRLAALKASLATAFQSGGSAAGEAAAPPAQAAEQQQPDEQQGGRLEEVRDVAAQQQLLAQPAISTHNGAAAAAGPVRGSSSSGGVRESVAASEEGAEGSSEGGSGGGSDGGVLPSYASVLRSHWRSDAKQAAKPADWGPPVHAAPFGAGKGLCVPGSILRGSDGTSGGAAGGGCGAFIKADWGGRQPSTLHMTGSSGGYYGGSEGRGSSDAGSDVPCQVPCVAAGWQLAVGAAAGAAAIG